MDPVGPEPEWDYVIAIYIKSVMLGVNYWNKSSVRSATCEGYVLAVERLFILRQIPSPVDLSDEGNYTKTIVNNLEKEEVIASQRKPLDEKIHAELINVAKKTDRNSLEASVADIATNGKATGWRAGEHSQTKLHEVDYHKYPSGKKVMRAINGNDVIFSDKNGKIFQIKKQSDLDRVHAVVITWRIQKNRRNGQQIRLIVDRDHPDVCPALAAARMAWRKARLRHSMTKPLAIFKDKKGKLCYVTQSKVTEVIRAAVKTVYPDMTKKELMKYSCHSVRVWACVTLDEEGMSPDFIKKRLRWLGESYRVYLRDTNKINEKHMEALKSSAKKTVELLDCPQQEDSEIDQIYADMGEYNDGD